MGEGGCEWEILDFEGNAFVGGITLAGQRGRERESSIWKWRIEYYRMDTRKLIIIFAFIGLN